MSYNQSIRTSVVVTVFYGTRRLKSSKNKTYRMVIAGGVPVVSPAIQGMRHKVHQQLLGAIPVGKIRLMKSGLRERWIITDNVHAPY